MKNYINILLPIFCLSLIVTSCGEEEQSIDIKRQAIVEKQKQINQLRIEVETLQKEVAMADPDYQSKNLTVVTSIPAEIKNFTHFLQLSGSIASRKNVQLSAQVSGSIEKIFVKEGQNVKKGASIIKIDDRSIRSSINELNTSLSLAQTMFEKQERLWNQKIGTEVQYIQAKNNVEVLESRLSSLQTQLSYTTIRAPFNGTIDQVVGLLGELAGPGVPLASMLSLDQVYVKSEVSEAHLGKLKIGQDVVVRIGEELINKRISSLSNVLNAANRTFEIEIDLGASGAAFKPNQMVNLEISDYSATDQIIIPARLVQKDNKGDYVFVIAKNGEDGSVAEKRYVSTGISYKGEIEIKEGITVEDILINEGAKSIRTGQEVKVDNEILG